MTLRQVSIALERIDVRTHNDRVFSASLHGHKMNIKKTKIAQEFENIDSEKEKEVEDAMLKAIQRKKWQRKA